ncbi:MAG: amidohydrolase family protein [Dehalococcoidales bacterium]|nr:amidohydrolase family protein [Dehalococcoidales bacterium]
MIVVDSHCHVSRDWYEPVESLLYQMNRNKVEQAVLIQTKAETTNDYQFECVRRYPGKFASVVRVDVSRPDAGDELERLVERGARGVRFMATTRSPGDDPLAIWRKAEQLKLPVSCLALDRWDFTTDEFARLVEAVPSLPIVLEHLGSLSWPGEEAPPFDNRRKVFALSRYPNVYLKVHGLGEFTPRPDPIREPRPFGPEVPPLFELAYQAFGAERLMWGSDYPPVSGREGYANALGLTMEQFAGKSRRERELIFGQVARRVFGPI